MTHTVYLIYGESGDLLYVGCTSKVGQRYALHESMSPWWHLMVWTRELGPYTKREALDLETDLIWTLGPLCNRPMKGDYKQFGLRASEQQEAGGKYSPAEQRAIRRRNLDDVPAARAERLLEASREALNMLGAELFPDGLPWLQNSAPTERRAVAS